jgi:tetratricopeptide (TPR) repeat protein
MSASWFSIVVLTRNETHTLPRLLASLRGFIERDGEVLVVDTGSDDGTPRLAARSGCRVEVVGARFDTVLSSGEATAIEDRFCAEGDGPLVAAGTRLFDFGAARQFAGELGREPWALHLDASDEVLALDLGALGRAREPGTGTIAYTMRLGDTRFVTSRFYDRRLHRWKGRAHEALYPAGDGAGPPPRASIASQDALSVRHLKDAGKPRAYLPSLALDVLEAPRDSRWRHYLGRELYYHGWYRSAVAVLMEHADLPDGWNVERSQSLCFAGECFERLGDRASAVDAYRRAIVIDDTRREPRLRLAALCCCTAAFDEAVGHVRAALSVAPGCPYPESEANYTWRPHALLYWSLFWKGKRDEARAHWETCRTLLPEDPVIESHERLFAARGDACPQPVRLRVP